MREIKFRYWDTKYKKKPEMVYCIEVTYDWEDAICDQEHLMQFTGLKDKNGKEIYEGDFVSNLQFGVGEIKYIAPSFCVSQKWNLRTINCGSRWEIVGNKFESPELLK